MRMTEEEFAKLIEKNPNLAQHTEMKKGNKYKNKKIYVYDGVPSEVKLPDKKTKMVFDSKKEYRRWIELCELQKAGEISDLKRQQEMEIIPDFKYEGKKVRGIKYKADFIYIKNGRTVVEDVKPFDKKTGAYITTRDFNLKWKMLKYKFPEYEFVLA